MLKLVGAGQILVFANDKLKHIGHCAPSFILETMETMITHLTWEQLEAGLTTFANRQVTKVYCS
jgi:hypothetical protein